MAEDGYTTIRIKSDDLEWLRARAGASFRSVPQEISAIREVLTLSNVIDVLPHPEGSQVVPVARAEKK
jgi:hypothetical protein